MGDFADGFEFQNGLKEIGEKAMYNSSCSFVKLPDTIEILRYGAFCVNMYGGPVKVFDFTDAKAVPICESGVFDSERLFIVVPDSLISEWRSTTNWAEYSDNIYAASTFNFNAI